MATKTKLGPIKITDKEGEEIDFNDHPLLHRALTHAGNLWVRCEKKFMDAMDGSDRKQIQVAFAVTLNTKEKLPVVDVQISFKDKAKESGLDVVKTYRLSETEEIEDPDAPPLPGVDMEEVRKGRLSKDETAAAVAANGEGANAEGGEKPRGRGRPKKKKTGDGEQTATE